MASDEFDVKEVTGSYTLLNAVIPDLPPHRNRKLYGEHRTYDHNIYDIYDLYYFLISDVNVLSRNYHLIKNKGGLNVHISPEVIAKFTKIHRNIGSIQLYMTSHSLFTQSIVDRLYSGFLNKQTNEEKLEVIRNIDRYSNNQLINLYNSLLEDTEGDSNEALTLLENYISNLMLYCMIHSGFEVKKALISIDVRMRPSYEKVVINFLLDHSETRLTKRKKRYTDRMNGEINWKIGVNFPDRLKMLTLYNFLLDVFYKSILFYSQDPLTINVERTLRQRGLTDNFMYDPQVFGLVFESVRTQQRQKYNDYNIPIFKQFKLRHESVIILKEYTDTFQFVNHFFNLDEVDTAYLENLKMRNKLSRNTFAFKRKARKSKRKSNRKSKRKARKSKRKARKSKRKSNRKSKRKARKSKRKARKAKRKSK